jgi:polar amino acid transport system substrate-binding protein
MKFHLRPFLLGMAALAMIGVQAGPAFAASRLDQIKERGYIRVAVANEIPYGYVNASGEATGIAPSVAQKVLAKLGIKDIQWIVTPFGSLIPGLKAGRFDMVAASQAILPARCQQVLYSRPNSSYGEGLLVKTGNPDNIHSYEDFKKNTNLKMAIMSGADQLDFAHDMGIPDSQIVVITSNSDAPSVVASSRANAYAATGLTVERLAKKSNRVQAAEPFSDPIVNNKPVRSWGGFTFSKDERDLRDAFNKELAAYQKTADYRKTLMSFGLSKHDIDQALEKTTDELCGGPN